MIHHLDSGTACFDYRKCYLEHVLTRVTYMCMQQGCLVDPYLISNQTAFECRLSATLLGLMRYACAGLQQHGG